MAASTAGSFRVRLPPGEYLAVAAASDRIDAWHDPAFLAAASAVATRLSIEWGDKKTLDLTIREVR